MEARAALLCLTALSLAQGLFAAVCPASCFCSTTPDGLHKATCSNIDHLQKFLLNNKRHNINILDLSHNNITKLTHELDNMKELVALDLSTNGFVTIDRFLQNTTKLVHLKLANNRIKHLSLSNLPKKLSSLDLRDNLLKDVPREITTLSNLEHLQLEGNPLECSCKNIMMRDYLLQNTISVDDIKCHAPYNYFGYSWLKIKTKEVCKFSPTSSKFDSMELKAIDSRHLADNSILFDTKSSRTLYDLDQGQTWVADTNGKDYESEDEVVFLRAKRHEPENSIEGSGRSETIEDVQTTDSSLSGPLMDSEDRYVSINDQLEGSGEGSGFGFDGIMDVEETTVAPVFQPKELYTEPVSPFLGNEVDSDDTSIPEDIDPVRPSIFLGSPDWRNNKSDSTLNTDISAKVQEDAIAIDKSQTEQSERVAETTADDKPVVYRTGTYICVAVIVVLLVGLVAFAIIRGQVRKRRDRQLQRQQKRDVEIASREMVDMNTSLLGKPAPTKGSEKKANGKYELVPTHDPSTKKSENGDVTSTNDLTQNKSSPRDNNQNREERPHSYEPADSASPSGATGAPSPVSKKQRGSLSSEEIFVPGSEDGPHSNGATLSDITQPLTNGDQVDSDLSPSKYVPVYSLDMGRVRIKMTETPKPKTPVLVNRSRSNAGDFVVTPSLGQKLPVTKT